MKETRDIMGMPITVELADADATQEMLDAAFDYFTYVDETFSPYKADSEVSRINDGRLSLSEASPDVQDIYAASDATQQETNGFFDHRRPDGSIDPSGIVKGWSIQNAANLLENLGCKNFCVDAAGDIQARGTNTAGLPWSVGIRHPFETGTIAKVVYPHEKGVATSGTYVRGEHIYNPKTGKAVETPFVSLTVIGPNVYHADRFATAAFAMGEYGPLFIEDLAGYEAYAITQDGRATFTSGFDTYTTYEAD